MAMYNFYEPGNTSLFKRHECIIANSTDNKVKLLIRPEIKKQFKAAASNFIAYDLRPYLAIEGDGLFELLTTAMKFGQIHKKATVDDLRRALPGRNTVRAYLEKVANDVKAKIKSVLQEAKQIGGFAVCSDSWTDKYRRLTYICLVAHCNTITEKGIERHSYNLYCGQITELVKTKEVIVGHILNVLHDYGFSEDEVSEFVTFVTDRGSNFKYGLISAGYSRHSCYAHLIHNLIKAMMKKKSRVYEIVETAAKVTALVKNSNINSQLPKTIKSFSRTRWNGVYTMLHSIGVNFANLDQLLFQRQRQNPKETCFDLFSSLKASDIKSICEFLEQFANITNDIEGQAYETLSMVWPIYSGLNLALEEGYAEEESSRIIEEMKDNGRKYLTSKKKDFMPTMKHKMATVLNPFAKKLPGISESEKNEVYAKIEEIISDRIPSSVSQSPVETVERPEANRPFAQMHSFLQSFYRIDDDVGEADMVQPTELETYLNHRITAKNHNVTEWWNEHQKQYPKLFKLFATLSSIPASSASGERIFSRAGMVITNRRNTILPENVNSIIVAGNSF